MSITSRNPDNSIAQDAQQLLELGIVDEVLDEPTGGAHRDWKLMSATIRERLLTQLTRLEKSQDLPAKRYAKFRAMGRFDG